MKLCNLFPVLDNQEKRIKQIHGLSNVLMIAGGLSNHSQNDLYNCLSIVSDLSEEMLINQTVISEGITGLNLINKCINGTISN